MSAIDFCQRFSVRVEFLRPSPHSLKGEISVSYLFIQKNWESYVYSQYIAIPAQGSGELSRVRFQSNCKCEAPTEHKKTI